MEESNITEIARMDMKLSHKIYHFAFSNILTTDNGLMNQKISFMRMMKMINLYIIAVKPYINILMSNKNLKTKIIIKMIVTISIKVRQ